MDLTDNGSVLDTEDQSSTPSLELAEEAAADTIETEAESGDVSPEQDVAEQTDWESRFKGQQTVANQKAQEAQRFQQMLEQERQARLAIEQQMAQYEMALYAQQLQSQGVPQEQIQQQVQAQQAQRAVTLQQQYLAQQAQQLAQREQQIYQTAEEAARPIAAQRIAEKYKVKMADILDLPTPDAMIRVAEAIANSRKAAKAPTKTNANRFEGQGLGSTPLKQTADLDEAAASFMERAKQLGFG